ncbi:MAG: hypothetical protein HY000_16640, partial [Planctomycetes bacterium]|nr:hypothetical protein [Planctomycetota bacterium]
MIILHCLILAASLVAADASAAGPASQPSGVVAQLYVWTQHYNQRRERLDDNLDEVFATTKRAGYDAVQGFLNAYDTPASAEVFAAKLKQHELVMPIAYVGGPMHT